MTLIRIPAAITRHTLTAVAEAVLLAVIVTALLGLVAPVNPAGNGLGSGTAAAGRAASVTSAVLTVTPNPVGAYGATYTVRGSGFKTGVFVAIQIYEPSCCRFFSIMPDSSGNIAFTTTTASPGTYKIEARQRLNSRKSTLMATTTFTVAS